MDSLNTREYRTKIARKIIKIKQELDEIDAQSADKWKEHPIRVNHRIIKLQADKERLRAELRFMCRKIVTLSDEIIEALRTD
ncbi:CiV19.5g2-like-1 protein [Chelonus insularis]|nr:CiV19.5g2-like-1 protein [Chelonus insularis]